MIELVSVEMAAFASLLLMAVVGGIVVGAVATRRADGADEQVPDGGVTVDAGADLVELDPPRLKGATFGLPQKLWRLRRQIKKRRKLAKDGYVQWYLIDGTFPVPKYVKPEYRGDGIPSYELDGERYLMPREAMVGSEEQGLWTIAHKRGEADPINLRDPTENAIPADTLEEYLQMGVTTSPPSWLDQFDITAADLIKWGLAAFILIVVGQSLLSGGGPI